MKRTFFIKTIFSLVAVAGVLSGCQKQLDINHNPNFPSPDQATAKMVFPVAVVGTMAKTGGDMAIVGGIWGQYFTQSALASQFRTVDAYNMTNSDFFTNDVFTDMYTLGLKNYQFITQQASASADWNYYLMGTVMKAYTAAFLVDLYDSIPYSQALNGLNNLQPKFDDGYSVYTSVISSIDSALGKDFTATTVTLPGDEDLVFGGDMDMWKKFANTLKLKLYLRMVNKHNDVAQAGIQKMFTSGAEFLDADAAITKFRNSPSQDNPFFEYNQRTLNTTSNLRASTTFVSWLKDNNDTLRANAFFGSYHPNSQNQGDYGGAGGGAVFVQTATDPVELISAAESYFMQAEAKVRYGVAADAQALYESGVTAAFSSLKLDASSYIAPGGVYQWGNEIENGQPLDNLSQIYRQEWASFPYGCHQAEGWFLKNRTDFPKTSAVYSNVASYVPGQFVVTKNSVLSKPLQQMPKRFPYPYNETSRNSNAPQQVVPIYVPVWWGK
jgi:hypothetical protein